MAHIHEDYDFVVSIFLIHEDKVLFVNHPRYDKWLPIGGHIELDEDPEQALFREIMEETGVKARLLGKRPKLYTERVKSLITPDYMNVHDANPPHKHISLIYFAITKNSKIIKSDEHTEIKWLAKAELKDPKYKLPYSLRFYAQEALEKATKDKS